MRAVMEKYKFAQISVEKLLLDVNNPRHDILEDQKDAIREMIADQHEKLVNLARDIVQEGINPSELTIVTPDGQSNENHVVLEGNRRLAAIKLLHNPSLANLGGKPSVAKFFNENSQKFSENPVTSLRCVVFENRDEATHWIQLKHTGENKGVGVVGWDSEAVARFRQRLGKPSLALQVVEFVKKNSNLDETQQEKLNNIRLTNVARLVNDPDVRKVLGIGVDNGDIISEIPPEEVVKGLTKIVNDVSDKDFTVNDIRHKKDREEYLKKLGRGDLPSKATKQIEPWRLESLPANNTVPLISAVSSTKKSVPLTSNRKNLIPPRCILKIGHQRINKIYKELRGLEVDDYPNACAVMLRVFLELSLEEYAKHHGIMFADDTKLNKKIMLVVDYLEKNNIMKKAELKSIRVAYTSQDALFSTNTLNAYIHNKDFSPRAKYLKETWDSMQSFFEAMWS
jgi:hypothetical protein